MVHWEQISSLLRTNQTLIRRGDSSFVKYHGTPVDKGLRNLHIESYNGVGFNEGRNYLQYLIVLDQRTI